MSKFFTVVALFVAFGVGPLACHKKDSPKSQEVTDERAQSTPNETSVPPVIATPADTPNETSVPPVITTPADTPVETKNPDPTPPSTPISEKLVTCIYDAVKVLKLGFCIENLPIIHCERDMKRLSGRIGVQSSEAACPTEISGLKKVSGCKLVKPEGTQMQWDYSGKMPCRGEKVNP